MKAWDLFRVLPPEKDLSAQESDARVNLVLRWVKLFACIIVCLVVLGTGVLAKGTVLFMATQTSKTQIIAYCNTPEIDISK